MFYYNKSFSCGCAGVVLGGNDLSQYSDIEIYTATNRPINAASHVELCNTIHVAIQSPK